MEDLAPFLRSMAEQDPMPVVVCNLRHEIIYMNPAAVEHYSDRGGENLIGLIIFDCHNPRSSEMIKKAVEWFSESTENNVIHTFYSEVQCKDVYMVALRDRDGSLIGYYEKHESRKRDSMPFYQMN